MSKKFFEIFIYGFRSGLIPLRTQSEVQEGLDFQAVKIMIYVVA